MHSDLKWQISVDFNRVALDILIFSISVFASEEVHIWAQYPRWCCACDHDFSAGCKSQQKQWN